MGAAGMLGRELFSRLAEEHEVVGKDYGDFDLASALDCRRLVEENRPEVVINAAAYTDVDGAEANEGKCFAVNAEGVKNIALACRDKKITIVHFSTDYVFDGIKNAPYQEGDACCPLNVYGLAKRAGEEFLFDLADHYLLVRSAWLYGGEGKNFVSTVIEKGRALKQLDVVDDQVGSPTSVCDLVQAVKRLVEEGREGIFHVTNQGSCSWYEFARAIVEYAGLRDVEVRPIKSDRLARPAKRPGYSVLDGGKLSRETGVIMRHWRRALRDCLEKKAGIQNSEARSQEPE